MMKIVFGLPCAALPAALRRRVALPLGIALQAALLLSCGSSGPDRTAFDFQGFENPPPEFRPWVRWWWPGNDVEEQELRREVAALAEAVVLGEQPSRAPGYKDWKNADALVAQHVAAVLAAPSTSAGPETEAAALLAGMEVRPLLQFPDGPSPIRHLRRRLGDGSWLTFLWNPERTRTGFLCRGHPDRGCGDTRAPRARSGQSRGRSGGLRERPACRQTPLLSLRGRRLEAHSARCQRHRSQGLCSAS